MTLLSSSGGAQLGHTQKTVVTVVGDDGECANVYAHARVCVLTHACVC